MVTATYRTESIERTEDYRLIAKVGQ